MSDTTRTLVIVSQQYPPDKSGHASRISDVASNLSKMEWDVEVLAPPPCFPHGEFDRDWYRTHRRTTDGVTVRRLWAWQPTEADPGTLSRLAYYVTFAVHAFLWLAVTRLEHDVVVTTTPPISTGLVGFVAAASNTPWVTDVRDLWIDASVSLGFIPEGGILERGSRRFQHRVLRTADAIAVTTETLGERLCDQYGPTLAEKLVLVPNGVDIGEFASADPADTSDRSERVDRSDRPAVVYVGNIGHAQALDTCVRAMGRMKRDAELHLIGGGDAVPDLREVAATPGIEDRVEFIGPVPNEEVPALLASAEIGLAPLLDDPELAYAMPTKLYEYMGAGLPVVTTGRGEIERFVDESGGGVHVPTDPDAVAAAIDRLLADDDRRRRIGAAGQAHVSPTYDREAITERFDEQLRHLVEAGDTTLDSGATFHRNVADGGAGARRGEADAGTRERGNE
jgi:glycosyltransferase involved in cell wall biosynthesis